MNCSHYRCRVVLWVFKYCQHFVVLLLIRVQVFSAGIRCLTSEACETEATATARGVTNVRLGRASGSTKVITTDRGGSLPAR